MKNFLTSILPGQGIYFITSIKTKVCRNHPCHSFNEMVKKAHDLDGQGYDVFFACSSFKKEGYVDASGKRRQRTAENAGWVKSFWLDIDCSAKKAKADLGYLDVETATAALDNFLIKTGLPSPMIVHSGGGLHVYWPMAEEIQAEQWVEVAKKLKAISEAPGTLLIVDKSRTTDLASVLRPIGTHNWKPDYDGPEVTLATVGEIITFDDFTLIVDTAYVQFCKVSVSTHRDTGLLSALGTGGYEIPDRVEEGGRNSAVLAHVGHLRGRGVAEDLVLGLVNDFNAARCNPPLDADEVTSVILRYEDQANVNVADLTPDEWPDPQKIKSALAAVPAFDVDLLPDVFKPLVADASELMQAPPDFLAVPLMVAAAATLGNGWAIAPKAKDISWKVPAVLWGAIIGRPGTKKSPCMDKALASLLEIERTLAADHVVRLQQYQTDKLIYEAALKKAKAQAAKSGTAQLFPLEPEEPQPERLVVNDSTYQKLGDILRGSPRGVAVVMDELVGLLETVEAKGQEGARAFYLAAWNGDQTHRIDRIGRGSIVIDRLSLCVLGGIQPGKLKNYVGQAMRGGNSDDGLMQRFQLLVWPDVSAEWIDVDRYYDQQAFDDVMATFTRIRDLKPGDVNARTDLFGGPAYLQFDAPAQARFNGARLGFERSVRSGMCHPALEAHFSKYPRMIAALALVIHLVDGGNGPVGVVATNKSIGWAKYLTKHAQRAYGAADNAAAQSAKALADRIEQGDVESGFTARSIVRKGWQHLSSNDVPAALEWLIDANWIVAEDRSTAGRPTKVYIINPKVGGKQ